MHQFQKVNCQGLNQDLEFGCQSFTQLDIIQNMEQVLEILKRLPFFMQKVQQLRAHMGWIQKNCFSLLNSINDLLKYVKAIYRFQSKKLFIPTINIERMLKPTKSLKSFHQIRSQQNTPNLADLQSMLSDLDEIDAKLNNMALGKKDRNEQKTSPQMQKGKTLYSSTIFNTYTVKKLSEQNKSFCIFAQDKPQLQTLTSQSKNPVCFTPRQKTNPLVLNFRNAQLTNKKGNLPQQQPLNFKNKGFKSNTNEKVTDKQNEKKILTNSWKKKISFHGKQNAGPFEIKLNTDAKKKQVNSKAYRMASQLHRQFSANYKEDEHKQRTIQKLFKELYSIAQ